jgi:collagenase-like PrtC family protease
VNDWCLPNCPNEYAHTNQLTALDEFNLSRDDTESVDLNPCRPCMLDVRRDYYWLAAQKEVLPGSLRHLEGIVDLVKLQGRNWITEDIAQAVESYAEMKSLSNPYFAEPPEAWDQITSCDRVCERCGWCEENIVQGAGKK